MQKPKVRSTSKELISRLYPDYPKESQIKTFYAALGRAIAAWQIVETYLYEVYRASTRAQRPGAEACAFFSVPAFRAKLNLTSAAVKFVLHGRATLLKEWGRLYNHAAETSVQRNRIAHGAVWTQFQEKRKERKIYVGPNMSDFREALKRQPGQEPEILTLTTVRGYEKDFRELAQRLREFSFKILAI